MPRARVNFRIDPDPDGLGWQYDVSGPYRRRGNATSYKRARQRVADAIRFLRRVVEHGRT